MSSSNFCRNWRTSENNYGINLLTREIEQNISSKAITHTSQYITHTQLQWMVTHTVVTLPFHQQIELVFQYRQTQAMLKQNLKLFCINLVQNKLPTHLAQSCEILTLPTTIAHWYSDLYQGCPVKQNQLLEIKCINQNLVFHKKVPRKDSSLLKINQEEIRSDRSSCLLHVTSHTFLPQ